MSLYGFVLRTHRETAALMPEAGTTHVSLNQPLARTLTLLIWQLDRIKAAISNQRSGFCACDIINLCGRQCKQSSIPTARASTYLYLYTRAWISATVWDDPVCNAHVQHICRRVQHASCHGWQPLPLTSCTPLLLQAAPSASLSVLAKYSPLTTAPLCCPAQTNVMNPCCGK
jgi:hypothetical protein